MTIKTRLATWATKIVEWVNKKKGWVAAAALALLVLALVFLSNPITAVGAAVAAGVLVLLKEVLAALGKAKEADDLDALIKAKPDDLGERREAIEKNRRTFDVWSSICGMFATIAGVPAAFAAISQIIK